MLQKESNSAEYYAMLLSQNENQSILIHDLKTHLQSIELLNEKGEADKINEYILNLMETSGFKETSRICDYAMLNAIFCNLLDNAVEAAENIPNSFIELTVERKENSPFIIIVVINSCLSAPKYDQSGLPVTHKSDKGRHGFGIKSIRKAAKKYQGDLQMYYDNESAAFHTIVTLKQ